MAKDSEKRKAVKKATNARIQEAKRRSQEATVEQMEAIAHYVPPSDRWVSAHPWMAQGMPDDLLSLEETRERARSAAPNCPGNSAINMLMWAIKASDKFWQSYTRKVDRALLQWERRKHADRKRQDKPEHLEDMKAQLDKYLADRGLSRAKMPVAEWYEPAKPGIVQ